MFNNRLIFTLNSYLISDKTIRIKTGKSYAEISVIEKHTGEPLKKITSGNLLPVFHP